MHVNCTLWHHDFIFKHISKWRTIPIFFFLIQFYANHYNVTFPLNDRQKCHISVIWQCPKIQQIVNWKTVVMVRKEGFLLYTCPISVCKILHLKGIELALEPFEQQQLFISSSYERITFPSQFYSPFLKTLKGESRQILFIDRMSKCWYDLWLQWARSEKTLNISIWNEKL